MESSKLIDKLGGTTIVSNLVGIKPPSVTAWRDGQIPIDKLILLAVVAEKRGISTRKKLLPTMWKEIWPELIPKKSKG